MEWDDYVTYWTPVRQVLTSQSGAALFISMKW